MTDDKQARHVATAKFDLNIETIPKLMRRRLMTQPVYQEVQGSP